MSNSLKMLYKGTGTQEIFASIILLCALSMIQFISSAAVIFWQVLFDIFVIDIDMNI